MRLPLHQSVKRVICLQHVPFEGPGTFASLLASHGCRVESRLVPRDGLPDQPADALLVMGGPMSVNDPLDWLQAEREFIRESVHRGAPYLGICLGSQLLAAAMGGAVGPGPAPEIGLTPIRLTPEAAGDPLFRRWPRNPSVLEWHGEGIVPPPDAVVLASSDLYPVQAFRVGRAAYGLLFHVELEADGLAALCAHCAADLPRAGRTADELRRDGATALPGLRALADGLAEAFAGLLDGPRGPRA